MACRKTQKYKRVRHYHEPGDFHELTFSCYSHLPLLRDKDWCRNLAAKLDNSLKHFLFRLIAFVFMPEHVHLLVFPMTNDPDLGGFLAATKRPHSAYVKQELLKTGSSLVDSLTIRERPGRKVFRYWQEGPGYDRNLSGEKAVLAAIDYIHMNPVRRGLCERAVQWKWSSARFYLSNLVDPDLPTIHGVPADLWDR